MKYELSWKKKKKPSWEKGIGRIGDGINLQQALAMDSISS